MMVNFSSSLRYVSTEHCWLPPLILGILRHCTSSGDIMMISVKNVQHNYVTDWSHLWYEWGRSWQEQLINNILVTPHTTPVFIFNIQIKCIGLSHAKCENIFVEWHSSVNVLETMWQCIGTPKHGFNSIEVHHLKGSHTGELSIVIRVSHLLEAVCLTPGMSKMQFQWWFVPASHFLLVFIQLLASNSLLGRNNKEGYLSSARSHNVLICIHYKVKRIVWLIFLHPSYSTI